MVGSVVTGVSSLCVIAEYDLKKYRDLLDKLGDASVDIEAVLDEFPIRAQQHRNDRYNASRRTRDTAMEEEQFLVMESLVNRYQEQRSRLTDVESDDGTILDDAVDVCPPTGDGFGLLTHTRTHYPFTERTQRDQGSAPDVETGDEGLGLGLGELSGIELQEWLASGHTPAVPAGPAAADEDPGRARRRPDRYEPDNDPYLDQPTMPR